MKLLSIVLAYVALAAAFTAVVAMLFRLGRGAEKTGPPSLWVHRVAGYTFLAITVFLFVGMLYKMTAYGKEISARVAWHGAAGFAVVAFMFLKWAVVRPFRGLMKFAPALGMVPHMRPGATERDPLRAARFVFAEKCGKCHHLRGPLAKPRAETDWPPLVERMRAYDRAWISDVDAEEIELYLVNDYGPGR